MTYLDSLGVGHVPAEIKKFIIKTFRIQSYDSVKCAYFCIGIIDFMFKTKILK